MVHFTPCEVEHNNSCSGDCWSRFFFACRCTLRGTELSTSQPGAEPGLPRSQAKLTSATSQGDKEVFVEIHVVAVVVYLYLCACNSVPNYNCYFL